MILGGLVMISIGLFIIIGTFKLFKPTDYSTWKDAESIVEKVRTETWDDGELRPCLPRIIVSFELDGELIKGKSNCIGTEKTIKQVIAKYPKGSKVCFKYDDSPKETIVTKIADNLNFRKLFISTLMIKSSQWFCGKESKIVRLWIWLNFPGNRNCMHNELVLKGV